MSDSMREVSSCTCLSISRDPLCVFHGDNPTSALRAALAQSEAARQKAEQERDYVKKVFDHMAHLCGIEKDDAIRAEQKLRSIRSALRALVAELREDAAASVLPTYTAERECANRIEAILEAKPEQP